MGNFTKRYESLFILWDVDILVSYRLGHIDSAGSLLVYMEDRWRLKTLIEKFCLSFIRRQKGYVNNAVQVRRGAGCGEGTANVAF